jgi:hypothetical protein
MLTLVRPSAASFGQSQVLGEQGVLEVPGVRAKPGVVVSRGGIDRGGHRQGLP